MLNSFPRALFFYLFGELSVIFNQFEIVVCNLFHFGRVYNLLFGKGLKVVKTQDCVVKG